MSLPETMRVMVTVGHGDMDKMLWHEDWPRPDPGPGEVLLRVKACGLNNTDINTRIGWYSKAVTGATSGSGYQVDQEEAPAWAPPPIAFPRIQGADVCGEIVAVGAGVDVGRLSMFSNAGDASHARAPSPGRSSSSICVSSTCAT